MSPEVKKGHSLVDIPRIVKEVPNYTQFMTGPELAASSVKLLEQHHDMVKEGLLGYEILGQSTEGRDIDLLRIGKGKKKVLWVGTPHPNEPVGTLTIDFLSHYLCEHPKMLATMDTTFVFIKNADPDGLALNESWLKAGIDPLTYALGFYRPAGDEQVEWGFPIDYETLHFNNPPMETKAVMKALQKYRPDFLYSLHNASFGGAYYYMEPRVDDLFIPLQENLLSNGLSIRQGDAEMPSVEKWADGIFQELTVKRSCYDYFKKNLNGDPAERIVGGAFMSEYLRDNLQHDHLSLVSEAPYFTSEALKNTSLSGITRREAIINGANTRMKIVDDTRKFLRDLGDMPDSRLKRAIAFNLQFISNLATNLLEETQKPAYDEIATVAEVYVTNQCERYYQIIQLGQVYRLAIEAGQLGKAEEIKAYIEDVITDINAVSPIQALPIQNLVCAQVGAGLIALQQLLTNFS